MPSTGGSTRKNGEINPSTVAVALSATLTEIAHHFILFGPRAMNVRENSIHRHWSDRNRMKLPPVRPAIEQIEVNGSGPHPEGSPHPQQPSLNEGRWKFMVRGQHQRVGKVDPLRPYVRESGCEFGSSVVRLEGGRAKVTQNRVVAGLVGLIDRRHRAPEQL